MNTRLFDVAGLDDGQQSDTWYTPRWVFDGLGLRFDLDVAAPSLPLCPWIPADGRYTVDDDGLLQPWHGLVWCNPPYSDAAPWCKRWAEHPDGVLLIRADLSTSGAFMAWRCARAMYVPERRLQFVNGHGERTGSSNFTAVLLARGDRATEGLHALARITGATREMGPR